MKDALLASLAVLIFSAMYGAGVALYSQGYFIGSIALEAPMASSAFLGIYFLSKGVWNLPKNKEL